MGKSNFFTGQPIFSQLLHFIPRSLVKRLASQYQADRYCKKFDSYTHLVSLLYAVLNRCDSLREVTSGLLAWEHRLLHLGITHYPRRSTISDANNRRNAVIFEQLYLELLKRYAHLLSDSRPGSRTARLYIFDATTITLFQDVLQATGLPAANGKRKGGIKVHTLIRSDQDVPAMIRFSPATANDTRFLKDIQLPRGAIIVFDKGYNDYNTFNRFTSQGISWVTRLRNRTSYEVRYDRTVNEQQLQAGVISDQEIILGHHHQKDATHVKARLVTYCDAATGKQLQFISNNFRMAPATIAGLYRNRWQIELLFKRVKQNYPLKYFLGDSENAIRLQIWSALIADLLLKIVQRHCLVRYAFANLTAIIRLHLMTYIELFSFLKCPEKILLKKLKDKPPDHKPDLFA
jgi:hypothetical protein